ncbi:hypothetical protein KCV07_g510, partial [Aureobasidium melanogenum]
LRICIQSMQQNRSPSHRRSLEDHPAGEPAHQASSPNKTFADRSIRQLIFSSIRSMLVHSMEAPTCLCNKIRRTQLHQLKVRNQP